MSLIIPYIWIFTATLVLILLTKRKFEIVLPLTFIIGIFLFYISGILGNIHLGLYFCCCFSFIAVPLVYKERSSLKALCVNNIFTMGWFVFTIFYIFLNFYHRYTAFSTWDEFQHWGPMIKETLRLNNFYSIPDSTLQMHKDYPPFVTLLQVLWCKLCGGYSEAYCYRSMSIFTIALFMPTFCKYSFYKIKDWIRCGIHALLIILLNLINFYLLYAIFETIYTDYMLGVFAAYVIYLVISSKGEFNHFSLFNLSISLSSLLMIKQMGIAFFAMAIFLVMLFIIVNCYSNRKKISWPRVVIYILFFAVIPLLIFKSWDWHIAKYSPDFQFKLNQISIRYFIQLVLHGTGEEWQVITLNNYVEAINHRPLINMPISLNYWQINIFISVLLYLVLKFFSDKEIKIPSSVVITYGIGVVGYALSMLLLYVFSFGPLEGPILASFERYINTYLYFGFCLIIFLTIRFISNVSFKKSMIIQFFLVLMLFCLCGKDQLFKLKIKTAYSGYEEQPVYLTLFNTIEENIEEGSNVLLIAQYQDQTVHILKYRYPHLRFSVISLGETKFDGDYYTKKLSLEEWIDYYTQFDYAYTYNTDDVFYSDYWVPITSEYLLNERLYKIKDNSFCLITGDDCCK